MKKLISSALIGLCSILGVASCSAKTNSETTNPSENKIEKTDMKTDGKKLVVYFSHTGENYTAKDWQSRAKSLRPTRLPPRRKSMPGLMNSGVNQLPQA